MDNKRRKIYDSDATVVEVSDTPKKSLKIDMEDHIRTSDSGRKTVRVSDVLDAFAGYIPPRISFIDSGEGQCVLCGNLTASTMRKVCYDCMKKHSKNIYVKAKQAIENGKTEFDF